MSAVIVWFRNDLRLPDNPALFAAASEGKKIVPVYIQAEPVFNPTAAHWWDHHALADLQDQIREAGGELQIYAGEPLATMQALIKETGATMVCWNRRYSPAEIDIDTHIKSTLKDAGTVVRTYNGSLLHEPWQVLNQSGNPYRVFSPYWRACVEKGLTADEPAPPVNYQWMEALGSIKLEQLKLLSSLGWDCGFYDRWKPNRADGLRLFREFMEGSLEDYAQDRDRPDRRGTSRLSPYLRSGLIGVREIVSAIQSPQWLNDESVEQAQGRRKLLSELGWREFSYYLLFHFPNSQTQALQEKFARFPWKHDRDLLQAWKEGSTGYPMVDAGMQELWHTGWMHNRVRMIVASFLVKHLLQPWQAGADWFMHTLVDADTAANTQGWQWTAGCGADTAPFFRVFNPVSQGKKFDSDGEYIRRWLPALAHVPEKYVHEPWLMDASLQRKCHCRIGRHYPEPIVDLKVGRERALQAWQSIRD